MKKLRKDFEILTQMLNDKPIAYLDNASTTQKPQQVLDAVMNFYTTCNANIYRGVHAFGEKATTLYEQAREKVAQFIGAHDATEIIFTRGTTDGINFIASTWAMQHVKRGDEIVLTELEHHSNLLPWQHVAQQTGAQLKFIPVFPDGTLDMGKVSELITSKTKLVAMIHSSNALGTHVDVATITKHARKVGAKVLIDAAQTVPHQAIDVEKLGCDFLVFSGHKMLAPTGIGVLYINKALHDDIPPYQRGGGTIFDADWHTATWAQSPQKFEAGTPPIAQAIGLGAAIDYLNEHVNFDQLQKHEAQLCVQLIDGLQHIDRIRLLGPLEELKQRGHLVSFVVDGAHAHDVAAYLDAHGICVRAGHHCVQPLAKKLGYEASVRASFYFYNTSEEVERLLEVMKKLVKEL